MNDAHQPHDVDAARAAARSSGQRRTVLLLYLAVALGSVAGSVLLWAASLAFADLFGAGFPWGTLFANVTGSMAIGFFARLTAPDGRLFAGPRTRHFVMTGVCGGYTTFSIFSLEALQLAQQGALPIAGLYVGASLIAWLAAVWLGDVIAARINRLRGASA